MKNGKMYSINRKILLMNSKINRADELINALERWLTISVVISIVQIVSMIIYIVHLFGLI